jgi:hypothetical protein
MASQTNRSCAAFALDAKKNIVETTSNFTAIQMGKSGLPQCFRLGLFAGTTPSIIKMRGKRTKERRG